MHKPCLILLLVLYITSANAQTFEKEYVTLFTYKVKQINEFIERFNDDDSTLIKLYYKKHYPNEQLTRERLIQSLFNNDKKNWNFKDINNFIDTVNNKINPLKLNMLGDKWYVKLNCPVTYKGVNKTVDLTMKLENMGGDVFKWVISGVDASFLRQLRGNPKYEQFTLPAPKIKTTALNSISNAIDFMDINKVSSDLANIANYFEHSSVYNDDLPAFVDECAKGKIKISSPNSIGYYFAQIPGWLLEIKRFNRRTRNSGWLISALARTSPEKKI